MNLKITLGGQLGYVATLLLDLYGMQVGLVDPRHGWPMLALIVSAMLLFYLFLRLGWSKHLRDPAMTMPQMLGAIVLSAMGYSISQEAHPVLLVPVCVTVAYSVFALRGRAVVVVQGFTMLVFALTSAYKCATEPLYYRPDTELHMLGLLLAIVVMLTWSGSQIADLRARQRRQREELAQMLTRIEELATHDTLTGLYNRRHMNSLLAHHVERAQRHGIALTLAILDLDHFKQVNDTHGHGVGDEVLKTFARAAQAHLGGNDTVARWGGEEFLLLSTASPQEVLDRLEQLRLDLTDIPAAAEVPTLRVSYSAGLALYQNHELIGHTIERADQALYEAKAAGRAQSRLAPASVAAAAQSPQSSSTSVHPSPSASETPIAKRNRSPLDVLNDKDAPLADAAPARLGWLLGHDPKQRLWVARSLLSALPYVFGVFSLAYSTQTGHLTPAAALTMALGLILTPTLLYGAIRSGWTQRLADPAITMAQVLVAGTWTLAMYAVGGPVRGALLITTVLILTVAACNMSPRKGWLACLYLLVIQTILTFVLPMVQPEGFLAVVERFNWIMMVLNLPAVMMMGVQLGKLRSRLKQQREQLKEAVARLSELATYDELTGLSNRTYMTEMLAHYARRHAQCGEEFTLALIDLDHFKRVNDCYGHNVGDEVLKAFAHQAGETLRHIDVISRWGGEEFLILCPQTTPEQALIGLERLRQVFSVVEVSHSVPNLRASFSAGLSAPLEGESIESTLARVDAALYDAKHGGRNRTCLRQVGGLAGTLISAQ
ncbi:MAG: diguanylate cyclase [Burkholderiales bacterium]|nr:diguanylate cyclase [Burkholderiales bacterium]